LCRWPGTGIWEISPSTNDDAEKEALSTINVRYRLANRLPLQAVQSASWQVQLLGVEKPEVRDH